jgi:hypothetical protein
MWDSRGRRFVMAGPKPALPVSVSWFLPNRPQREQAAAELVPLVRSAVVFWVTRRPAGKALRRRMAEAM